MLKFFYHINLDDVVKILVDNGISWESIKKAEGVNESKLNEAKIKISEVLAKLEGKNEKEQVIELKTQFPNGFIGEDLYPGLGKNIAKLNDIINNLIEKGYMKFKHADYPEGPIVYTNKS